MWAKLRPYFHQLAVWLIEPDAKLPQGEPQRRARLLGSLLLVLFFVGGFLTLNQETFSTLSTNSFTMSVVVVLIIGVLYGLSRTRWYQVAAVLSLLILYVAIFFVVLDNPHIVPDYALNLLVMLVLLAGLVLPIQWSLISAIMIIVGIATLSVLPLPHENSFYASLAFNITVSFLIITAVIVRQRDFKHLEINEKRYRNLLDSALEGIIISDAQGRILDANPMVERFIGLPMSQILGHIMIEFVFADDRRRAFEQFRSDSAESYELRVQHPQGTLITLEVVTKPYPFLPEKAFVTIARDITERKRAEQARLENELRYQALFRLTADAVFIIGLDGSYITANEQALAMLGCTMDELRQHKINRFVSADEINLSYDTIERLKRGEILPIYERQMRRLNGQEFIGEVSVMLVRDLHNTPLYFQSIVRDTTVRKRAEQQSFQLALERERVRMLHQFIGDVTHHFRTPLSNLKTSAYLLPRYADNPEKQRDYFDILNREINRLQQLMEDLFIVMNLERESSDTTTFDRVDMTRLAHQVFTDMKALYQKQAHTWHFSGSDQRLGVIGEANRLYQAIYQLVDNAARYTPKGGTIHIKVYEQASQVIIEIGDSGIGIDPEDVPHIFENFYRSDSAKHIDHSRSGLGLSIAKKIIAIHRGHIEVSSEMGLGSIFKVILPLANLQDKLPQAQDTLPPPTDQTV